MAENLLTHEIGANLYRQVGYEIQVIWQVLVRFLNQIKLSPHRQSV